MNFFRGVRHAKKLINEGVIGDVLYCHSARNGWEEPQESISWKKIRAKSGGHLYQHIHEPDCIQFIMGEPESVIMMGGNVAHRVEQFGYEDDGSVSPERTREFTRYLIGKGVKGLYVCGSSGECIYQSKEERKVILENVMLEAKGKITIIAHVGCNNTADSMELAAHAESIGVDAIASIPPIYFHLPDHL